MSREKPSKKLSSVNLNDEALKKLLEPLEECTEQSLSGGGVRNRDSLVAQGGQIIVADVPGPN
jgi:hypothetical protein